MKTAANSLTFYVEWSGEKAAGLHPCSEEVTIQFKCGHRIDTETTDYWKEAVETFYDGARATLVSRAYGKVSVAEPINQPIAPRRGRGGR